MIKQQLDHEGYPKWNPDWVISPGETLADWMEENGFIASGPRGTTRRLLVDPVARACSMEPEQLQKILDGRVRIGTVKACKLGQGTGIPARLWLNLERQFRQGLKEGKHWAKDET